MGAIDSGNTAWILTSASLVFLMTPGVAFFYGGMVRAKAGITVSQWFSDNRHELFARKCGIPER